MAKNKMFIQDLFTDFEFEPFPEDSEIENSVKLEYIKSMIDYANRDKQSVFLYFAFALGTVVFLIEKISSDIEKRSGIYSIVLYTGITLMLLSAIFFFTYWRKTHKFQGFMISCIPSLNIKKTRDLWVRVWKENMGYFKMGLLFLSIGVFLSFTIIIISKL